MMFWGLAYRQSKQRVVAKDVVDDINVDIK